MLKSIFIHGLIAGLVAGGLLSLTTVTGTGGHSYYAMAIGYLIMLVALSVIFLAVKRHRDTVLGGVIKFWPALGMGLAISLLAGVIYAACWDATLAFTHMDFMGDYSRAMIDQARAKGASPEELAKLATYWEGVKVQYANPLYRWSMTFIEIFCPVGMIVPLVTAILLRNPRFMPGRA